MLAARHRARLAMEEGDSDNHEERRKICRIRRRLFTDDTDDNDDDNHNNENNREIIKNQLGKLDNETNSFIEERRKDLNNAKERWNFDFEKEEPLPGRYEWVKVDENFSDDNLNENLLIDDTHEIPNKLNENNFETNSSTED